MSVHKKSTNPYSFKQLLQNFKRKHAICSTLFNIISLCAPLILNLLDKIVLDNRSISTIFYILAWGLSIYTIVLSSLSTFYINRNTHDAYIPRFLDHIGTFSQDKFTMLSKEIHHKSKDPQKDILLYDAHAAVKDILSHLTYLVHDITSVSPSQELQNNRIKFFQLTSCISRSEPPDNGGRSGIPPQLPCRNLPLHFVKGNHLLSQTLP